MMTETWNPIVRPERRARKLPVRPARPYAVNLRAFYAALLLAPILVALLFFWILLIPVFALFLGFIPYLLVGTPMLWLELRRLGPRASCATRAMIAHLIGSPIVALIGLQILEPGSSPTDLEPGAPIFFYVFGTIFAAAWGAMFQYLYQRFCRNSVRERTS